MIILFLFYLHSVAAVYAFTKRWQETNFAWGFLSVILIVLIFSVGWTLTDSLLKLVIDKPGLGPMFDRDAMALSLVTVIEILFLYFQTMWKARKASA